MTEINATPGTQPPPAAVPAQPPRPVGMASLLLAALIGAEFMLQIVGTMMNVAVPNAQSDLALSVSTASWTLNGFFLAFAGFMLLGGRLGDVYGHRRMFLVGIGLLTVASVLAGLAPGIEVLIAGRVLQGLGAAIAAPTGLALVVANARLGPVSSSLTAPP